MTPRERQSLFALKLGQLIIYAYANGMELTLGEGYNAAHVGHMPMSLHYEKLAQDLNLFVHGKYITGDHPLWHQLGRFWKALHVDCRWGGDFSSRDYNHFSITDHFKINGVERA